MLYSLISSGKPSKYLEQIYVRICTKLGARLKIPDASNASSSAFSNALSAWICMVPQPREKNVWIGVYATYYAVATSNIGGSTENVNLDKRRLQGVNNYYRQALTRLKIGWLDR